MASECCTTPNGVAVVCGVEALVLSGSATTSASLVCHEERCKSRAVYAVHAKEKREHIFVLLCPDCKGKYTDKIALKPQQNRSSFSLTSTITEHEEDDDDNHKTPLEDCASKRKDCVYYLEGRCKCQHLARCNRGEHDTRVPVNRGVCGRYRLYGRCENAQNCSKWHATLQNGKWTANKDDCTMLETNKCAICGTKLNDPNNLKMHMVSVSLNCSHSFHPGCMEAWMRACLGGQQEVSIEEFSQYFNCPVCEIPWAPFKLWRPVWNNQQRKDAIFNVVETIKAQVNKKTGFERETCRHDGRCLRHYYRICPFVHFRIGSSSKPFSIDVSECIIDSQSKRYCTTSDPETQSMNSRITDPNEACTGSDMREMECVMVDAGLREHMKRALETYASHERDAKQAAADLIRDYVSENMVVSDEYLAFSNQEALSCLGKILTEERLAVLNRIYRSCKDDPFLDILETAICLVYQPPWDKTCLESSELLEGLTNSPKGYLEIDNGQTTVYDLDRRGEWMHTAPSGNANEGLRTIDNIDLDDLGLELPSERLYHGGIWEETETVLESCKSRADLTRPQTDFGRAVYFFRDFSEAVAHAKHRADEKLLSSDDLPFVYACVVCLQFPPAVQYYSSPKLEGSRWSFPEDDAASSSLRCWKVLGCDWVETEVFNRTVPGHLAKQFKRCDVTHDGCECRGMPCEVTDVRNRCPQCTFLRRCACVKPVGCHGVGRGGVRLVRAPTRRPLMRAIGDCQIDLMEGPLGTGKHKYKLDANGSTITQVAAKSNKAFGYIDAARKWVFVWKHVSD
eukprot:gb/GECG01009772.1/.p1 GENE.gb/GECG01009772.1/~~gb/GECG01009772.1/.p1  ORF type:complete len:796 (+),score=54.86 gb/GECG01009772.1/:1-2388(+)